MNQFAALYKHIEPSEDAVDHPTLRALLGRRDLGLRLVGDEAELDDGALDQPLRWVHSSDLVDPTPFLADDLTLLTTGSQFTDDDADEYVLYLQHESPGTELEPNWLPAPAEPFYAVMRLYLPKPEALDGRWMAPPVRQLP